MRLGPRARERVRREFFPEDYERALGLLTRWDTKDCAPWESPARMHAAALNVARGSYPALRRAVAMARVDFRDLLLIGDDPETRHLRGLLCDPPASPPSPEEEAFLAGIRRKPADNAVRLVYADWLDERGQEQAAEYLRVLCRWLACDPAADPQLIERERELRAGLGRRWLARVRGMLVRDRKRRKAK